MISDIFSDPIRLITECLDQKIILMKHMLDQTKQIQVQSEEEEIDIGDLLKQRGECIKRFEKCNVLMEQKVNEISEKDKELATEIEQALMGISDKSGHFTSFATKAKELSGLLEQTKIINAKAQENLQKQYDQMKEEFNNSLNVKRDNLFRK